MVARNGQKTNIDHGQKRDYEHDKPAYLHEEIPPGLNRIDAVLHRLISRTHRAAFFANAALKFYGRLFMKSYRNCPAFLAYVAQTDL